MSRLRVKTTKHWRESNPFIQPPGEEKHVPGVLHQPIHQAYKGLLKLGLTRPIAASTGACAALSIGWWFASPQSLSFSHVDVLSIQIEKY